MDNSVIGLGAGGHASALIEALRLEGRYELVGLLDRNPKLTGTKLLGIPILGADDLLPELSKRIHYFIVGLGSVGSVAPRVRLYNQALKLGMRPIRVIHPLAILSPSAILDDGVAVLAGAIINAAARIGHNSIINSGSIVEHNCAVGNHVHIATGARLCGGVSIGSKAHIGAGSTILQGVRIGNNSIIGAGAVVIANIPPGVTAVGVPAKILRQRNEEA